MPQSIDELLRAAKATLANANAFDTSFHNDLNAMPSSASIADITAPDMDPTGFKEVVENAKTFGKTFGGDVLGLAKTAVQPWKIGQAAYEAGQGMGRDLLAGNPGSAAVTGGETLSGLPLRQMGEDFSQGNYPALAGHMAAGLSLAALLRGRTAGEPEMAPTGRGVKWAPSEAPESLGPDLPPAPSPEPYTAAPMTPRPGIELQSFEPPAQGAGRITGNGTFPTPRQPLAVPAPVDRAGADYASYIAEHYPQTGPTPSTPSTPSARYAFHQDDFEGGSFPQYHIEGGPNHGSTVGADTLISQGIPVPETPDVAPTAPESPLTRLLKPRIPADVAARAMDRGEPILDSPVTSMEMRSQERGGGSTGADDPLAAREAHTGARMLDQGYRRNLGRGEDPLWDFLPDRLSSDSPATPTTPTETPTPGMPAAAAPPDVSASSIPDSRSQNPMDQLRELAARINAPRDAHFKLPEANVPDDAFARAADAVRKRNPEYRADEQLIERRARPRPGGGDVAPASAPDLGPEYAPAVPNALSALLKNESGEFNPQALREGINSALNPTEEQVGRFGALARAHQAGSLLFSPLTVGRIGVSNTFAALLKAAEHAATERSLAPIGRITKELGNLPQMARDAVEAYQHPDEIHSKLDAGTQPRGLFGMASRAVGAVDRPFRNAMERAGFSPEDALSVTQQRTPVTKLGRTLLAAQQGHGFTRTVIPFAKSGINLLEQGIIEPAQSGLNIARDIASGEGFGKGSDYVKLGGAAGAATLGAVGGKKLKETGAPNWLQRLALATTGQYEIPAELAQAAMAAKTPEDFAKSAVRNIPVIGPGLDLSPVNQIHRLVPKGLNPDYYTGTKRDTHSFLERLMAEIPGLAQTLPAKPTLR